MTVAPIQLDKPTTTASPALDLDPAHVRQRWALRAQQSPGTAHLELSEWADQLRSDLPPWRSERLVAAAVRGLVDGTRTDLFEGFD